MEAGTLERIAALLEVLGAYLAAGALEDKVITLMVRWRIAAPAHPSDLFTAHVSNADLLLATRRRPLSGFP